MPQVKAISKAKNGIILALINIKIIELIINNKEINFRFVIFSLKKKYPKQILIIGVIKYPIEASCTLPTFTANIKAVQLIEINNPVIDNNIIFFIDKKIRKKSFRLENNINITNKNIKDHKPL